MLQMAIFCPRFRTGLHPLVRHSVRRASRENAPPERPLTHSRLNRAGAGLRRQPYVWPHRAMAYGTGS